MRSLVRHQRPGALVWLLPALAIACGSELEPARPTNVAVAIDAAVGTVVHVTWHTDEPTTGYVEYGETQPMQWSSPFETEPSREHSATLLGLRPGTTYSYRVVTWDGDAGASDVLSLRTGAFPAGLPSFTATGMFDSYIAVPLRGVTPTVAILDPSGAIVWYHEDKSGLDVLRARISEDRLCVLYNRTSVETDSSEDSAIVRVPLDGSPIEEIPVPFLAHDFVALDDGRFAAIVVDRRDDADGNSVRGDAVVEISAAGAVTPVWSTWDSFDPAETPGDGLNGAWTYANSLFFDAGYYFVGLQNFSSIVKIPQAGGDPEWVLGSIEEATFDFGGGDPFDRQSGIVRYAGESMLVMDNAGGTDGSRVVEYSLSTDTDPDLATQVASFAPDPPVQVREIGGIVRQVLGEWVVSWGDAGRIDVVSDGDVLFTLRAENANLGYHDVTKSLYPAGTDDRTRTPLR